MHDDMHVGVEVSPGIVSNLFKYGALDTIGGKQDPRDGAPACAGAEMPGGMLFLPSEDPRLICMWTGL